MINIQKVINLFFRKFLSLFGLILTFFGIYLVTFSFCSTLTKFLIGRAIFICFSAMCCFLIAYKIKIQNLEAKNKYIAIEKHSVFRDIIYTFKSADYIFEVLALQSILVPIFVCVAIVIKTPLLPLILGTVF